VYQGFCPSRTARVTFWRSDGAAIEKGPSAFDALELDGLNGLLGIPYICEHRLERAGSVPMSTDTPHIPATTEAEISHASGPHSLTSAGLSGRRTTLLIALGLFVLAFAVYLRTLHNGFISYDDYDYITDNPFVHQGLTWQGIVHAFTTVDQANWFPLEWISLMGTSQFFGIDPFGYHLTNLFLHAIDTVLLFLLVQAVTKRTWRAAAVAALFVVFPLNVEAVAWATERKSVLSVFFLLLALAAYGWYVRKPRPARYALIAVTFALGLMTKAWLISFPFALLLLDYWPLQRFGPSVFGGDAKDVEKPSFGALFLEKIPLMLMSAASACVAVYAAHAGDALSISAAHAPIGLRIENALWSYVMYIAKGVWPLHLAIIYPFPQHYFAAWRVVLAALVLLAITVATWTLRERRYLIVGWLWYLGILFPMIGLVQTGTQSMSDRWAYIASWGLFVAVVWAMADFFERARLGIKMPAVIAACAIAAYGAVSIAQTAYWKNNETLYTHALAVTKQNGSVRVNLGVDYERQQRPDLAMEQYRQAVIDTPALGIAHYNLARLLDDQHQLSAAAGEYQLAIANTSVPHEISDAYVGLAAISTEQGRPLDAITQYGAALQANPTDAYALLGRGMIELRQGSLPAAESDFLRSAQIAPTPMTWYVLGSILEREDKWADAARAYQLALQMNPGLVEAQQGLQNASKHAQF
jgi:tetratricopeptide (TPR) repeat protein